MTIDELVTTLRAVPAATFTPDNISQLLAQQTVDDASLQPYVYWETHRYTRNLVFRNDVFELLAVCWECGTSSPIHDHAGQDCWLYIQRGALCIDTFVLDDPRHQGQVGTDIGVTKRERIARLDAGTLDHRGPANDIHRVINRQAFGERAISLHVYARPFDDCLVYEPKERTATSRSLRYDTVGGVRSHRPQS